MASLVLTEPGDGRDDIDIEQCLVCGNEMPLDFERIQTRNGPICMGCESTTIECWHISIGGSGGYFELSPENVVDTILSMVDGDSITIRKKHNVSAVYYHNLPEFDGF